MFFRDKYDTCGSARHIGRVHVSLAVTCHLHVWQNDRDLLLAITGTRGGGGGGGGGNGHRSKSQGKQLTLEKKFLPLLLPGLEPAIFQSRVRRSNHRAIPDPHLIKTVGGGKKREQLNTATIFGREMINKRPVSVCSHVFEVIRTHERFKRTLNYHDTDAQSADCLERVTLGARAPILHYC